MDNNVKNVIVQLRSREERGLLKYGVNTERKDLTNLEWLQHLQEELMDATVYIEKQKSEMADMKGMEWRKDGSRIHGPKDFDSIQYHGKTKNYKKKNENN